MRRRCTRCSRWVRAWNCGSPARFRLERAANSRRAAGTCTTMRCRHSRIQRAQREKIVVASAEAKQSSRGRGTTTLYRHRLAPRGASRYCSEFGPDYNQYLGLIAWRIGMAPAGALSSSKANGTADGFKRPKHWRSCARLSDRRQLAVAAGRRAFNCVLISCSTSAEAFRGSAVSSALILLSSFRYLRGCFHLFLSMPWTQPHWALHPALNSSSIRQLESATKMRASYI
jgi:hypothetical protein